MHTVLGCLLYGRKRTLEATIDGCKSFSFSTYVFWLPGRIWKINENHPYLHVAEEPEA
jgi:hypothetical protein